MKHSSDSAKAAIGKHFELVEIKDGGEQQPAEQLELNNNNNYFEDQPKALISKVLPLPL
jgi:hypothetical protein